MCVIAKKNIYQESSVHFGHTIEMDAFARRLWSRCKSQFNFFSRALTRDFNYATDQFFALELLMVLAGVRFGSKHVKLRRCWNVYRWLIYLPLIVIFWNFVLNLVNRAKLDLVLGCLLGTVGGIVTILRALLVLWYYEPLLEVRRYVNQRTFGRNLEPSLGIRSAAFFHNRKLVLNLVTFMSFANVCCFAIDISNFSYFKLPFDVSEAFPLVQMFCEKSIVVLLFGLAMQVSLAYVVLDMSMTALTAEVQVIAHSVADIFENAQKRAQRKLELEPGNAQNEKLVLKNFFWQHFQLELGNFVELHVEFLDIKNLIRPLLNATFLIVYFSTALIMASGAIYQSQLKLVTMFSVQTLCYCLGIGLECLWLTRLVVQLSETVSIAYWSFSSVLRDSCVKKNRMHPLRG